MKNKNTKNIYLRGYTLVEIIIYLAIFTLVSITVINSYIVVLSSFKTTETNRDLQESGLTLMERMSRDIRQSKNISIAGSIFKTSPGTLELNSIDNMGNDLLVRYQLVDGAANLYLNDELVDNLVVKNIRVDNLIFRRIDNGVREAVKIEVTLTDTKSMNAKSVNFYNTIILRNNY